MNEIKKGIIKAFQYILADLGLIFLLLLPIIMSFIYRDSIMYWAYIIIIPGIIWLARIALED